MNGPEHSKLNITRSHALETTGIYNILVEGVKEISAMTDAEDAYEAITNLLHHIIERLSTTGECLLLNTSRIFDEDYIYAHSLNVSLLSIRIGLRLKFDNVRLMHLGLLALTHAGKDIELPEELSAKIQHDKELDEIIRLADVYDALTHPPAYRHAVIPRETLETIISSDELFDRRYQKILIEELSLYPKGSGVQLSSNEIARVTRVNKGLLLRPVVKVIIDRQGQYLEKGRTVDLSKENSIYVLRPVPEEEMGK
jgi:HD-GYP domain-containing protein (c-di-GMP phosphodiesterase class II)